MDARGDLSLRVSGGLELNSDGSGWHCYLYPFFSAPAGSRLAAHALPGPAGDSDIPERGVLVPPIHTRPGAAARLPPLLHSTGAGRIAARGSRPVRSRPATRTSRPGRAGPGLGPAGPSAGRSVNGIEDGDRNYLCRGSFHLDLEHLPEAEL